MSSRSDQYAGETRRESDDRRNDDPYAEESDDGRSSYLPGLTWGGWPSVGWRQDGGETDPSEDEAFDDRTDREESSSGGLASLWDEGLITLLIVGGAILFLFPEPVTSSIGILLLGLGVLAWAIDWAT